VANNNTKISKFLSYVLRHNPDSIGLALDKNGWAAVDELLECASRGGTKLSQDKLEEVVEKNNKKRFVFSENGLFIILFLRIKDGVMPTFTSLWDRIRE